MKMHYCRGASVNVYVRRLLRATLSVGICMGVFVCVSGVDMENGI